ncbi:MAG: Rieske (2Fe-2S) protein [Limisphaerales bacterium]
MRRLISLSDLQEKRSFKFTYRQEGIPREGFVAVFQGQVVAYENVCRHVPITLDYGDGRFFNPDQTHFICQTHGATYEPLTGKCIAGPCVGAFLKHLTVEIVQGDLWLHEPK